MRLPLAHWFTTRDYANGVGSRRLRWWETAAAPGVPDGAIVDDAQPGSPVIVDDAQPGNPVVVNA